jgi:hypothetical protein
MFPVPPVIVVILLPPEADVVPIRPGPKIAAKVFA